MGPKDFETLLGDVWSEALSARGRVNILVTGRSGVGKSTLINSVFQGQLAETGQGRPVTRDIREISKPDIPLRIIDTRGLEMQAWQETLASLESEIDRRRQHEDPNEHVHVAWVCVSEDSRRIEDGEQALCRELHKRSIPIVAVITKSRADQGFRQKVLELLPEARNAVRVRAIKETLDDGPVLEPLGLGTLVEVTMDAVPEGHRAAFAAAQIVSRKLKRTEAEKAIKVAAAAAASVAYTPIPIPDAAVLVPIQVAMLARMTATYGIPADKGLLSGLVASVALGTGATFAGRAIVSGLLKLLPGIGTLAGGTVAAATAVALTVAGGKAYIAALENLVIDGGEPPSAEAIVSAFKAELVARRGEDETE